MARPAMVAPERRQGERADGRVHNPPLRTRAVGSASNQRHPGDMRAANPITLRGVRKTYGAVVALREVDLDIAPGEFLTLLGPSGSGKTTLLMIIAGFTRPDAGSIRIGGREVVLVPPHKRDIGLVFQ